VRVDTAGAILRRPVAFQAVMVRPLRILFFATARTAVGRAELEWPVPAAGVRVSELTRALAAMYPALAPTLRVSRFVRNGEYVDGPSDRLRPGDEFAVHPPYGGG
jgi:molybdopterin converting factor small subunit